MKKIGQLLSALALLSMTACGGGGGGGSNVSGTVYYSHEELAEIFTDRLWSDAGIDAELVKADTQQYDYIVVYDYDLDSYDAYWIGNYNVGENIIWYLDDYDYKNYYDLDYIGFGDYKDWYTGLVFEKTLGTTKDLLKVAAIREADLIKVNAEKISAHYGLSLSRATTVAELTLQMKNTPKDRMTDNDYDAYAKELLGASITDFTVAAQQKLEGNGQALKDLVVGTATHNDGMDPEDVDDIIQDVFHLSALK